MYVVQQRQGKDTFIGDDKFVLALASNDGQPASDELTMKWDFKKDDFEIVRPPAQL